MKFSIFSPRVEAGNFQFSTSKGFTLIELLVVIGVIGVLAGGLFTIVNPFSQIQKANDARRKSDLSQIQKALEQYYNDHGTYPQSSGSPNYYIVRFDNTHITPTSTTWTAYVNIVPFDPNTNKRYVYAVSINRQAYWLYASLDRGGNDPDACFPDSNANGTACSGLSAAGVINVQACGGNCSYGLSSPNVTP